MRPLLYESWNISTSECTSPFARHSRDSSKHFRGLYSNTIRSRMLTAYDVQTRGRPVTKGYSEHVFEICDHCDQIKGIIEQEQSRESGTPQCGATGVGGSRALVKGAAMLNQ